jgi:hypothetical protein
MTDPMEISFNLLLVSSFHIVEDITCLMSPAALNGDIAIDQREGSQKPLSSVDDNQLKGLAFKSSAIEIMQESFPGRLGFTMDLLKVDDFFLAVGGDS